MQKLVYDGAQRCPYLPDRVARMPLYRQLRRLTLVEADARFANSERRVGACLYRTACATCSECQGLRVPVATLTLIAPAGLGPTIDAGFVRGLARARAPGEVAHLLDRLTDGPNGLSAAAIAAIAGTLAEGRLGGLADSLLGETGQAVSLRADLARLAERMPVRLILGHRDRILDWRESLDVSARIAVHHLPRSGHMPQWEALAEVADILARVTGSR